MRKRSFALVVAVSLVACGRNVPESRAPAAGATPSRASAPVAAASPVVKPTTTTIEPATTSPEGLLLTARLTHPSRSLQQIAQSLGPLGSLVQGIGAAALAQMAVGAPVGAVLDLEQPVDIALAHGANDADFDVRVAGAASLVDDPSTEESFERYFTLVPIAGGMRRLRAREPGSDGQKPSPCLIAPGDSASRGGKLVCANDEAALRLLEPYVVQKLAHAPLAADLRVELFMREVEAALAREDPDTSSASSDPSTAAARALGRQFAGDISTVVLESGFDNSQADTVLTTRFAGTKSPLTRALLSHASPNGPPPEIFERLPQESAAAWYARGADPRDVEGLRTALTPLVSSVLVEEGLSKGDADAFVASIGRLALAGGAWAGGAGHRVDTALTAMDAYAKSDKGTRAKERARSALQGWVLVGIDEPAQTWVDAARALVSVMSTKISKDKTTPQFALAVTPPPPGLPRGSLHVELRPPPLAASDAAPKSAGRTIHGFVVPDGATTWLAFSESPTLAVAELRKSLSGAAPAGQLRTRQDVDPLRTATTTGGGFLSIAEMVMLKAEADTDGDFEHERGVLQTLTSLSASGTTPIPMFVVSNADPDKPESGGALSFELRFPSSVITDLSGAGAKLF